MSKTFEYSWEWRLAATPEALWPLVSDTNRFNRDAGVPAVEEPAQFSDPTRRLRLTRYGVTIEWEEEPFEWIRPLKFGVMRRYVSGPVREMRVQAELHPVNGGETLLRYQLSATARNAIGYAAIPLEIGIISARRFGAVFHRYAELARSSPAPAARAAQHFELLSKPARLSPGGSERLTRALDTLRVRGLHAGAIARLDELIRHGDDLIVARIQPYTLADAWSIPRIAAVELCLHATRAGLLDLQWDLLCPLCRGAKETAASIRDLPNTVHCGSCQIDFEANFEQSVELTFRTNSSVRHVDVFPFCVGGPQLTPHIILQQFLEPGETRSLNVVLEPGSYRIRSLSLPGAQLFQTSSDGSRVISFAPQQSWADAVRLVRPECTLVLSNPSDRRRLMIVERTAWSDFALTAAEVTALQQFRDLFASEALRPGETINVGTMTVLFTDLLDSTRMYREIGDAPAFGRVLNHFDVLRDALQNEQGALIKTIGDAVMAVFRSPAAALRTVFRAQDLLAELPDGIAPGSLKAGVHFGPCIAVTLNERLDYFGSTVNIAARLGALSAGGDIVISETVASDPEVQAVLSEPDIGTTRFQTSVKGFEEEALQLVRVFRLPAK